MSGPCDVECANLQLTTRGCAGVEYPMCALRALVVETSLQYSTFCTWLGFCHTTQVHRSLPFLCTLQAHSVLKLEIVIRATSRRDVFQQHVVHTMNAKYVFFSALSLGHVTCSNTIKPQHKWCSTGALFTTVHLIAYGLWHSCGPERALWIRTVLLRYMRLCYAQAGGICADGL